MDVQSVKEPDNCQLLIKTDKEHRAAFKSFAYSLGMNMTEYFHKIVEELPTWKVVNPSEKQ